MAGYSGTPLAKKLGLVADSPWHLIDAPEGFEALLTERPEGCELVRGLPKGKGRVRALHLFVTERKVFAAQLPKLRLRLLDDGLIWVSWPKGLKRAAIPTDMDEGFVRDTALGLELVDVKVCAVDAVWSGLKLVVPVALRAR